METRMTRKTDMETRKRRRRRRQQQQRLTRRGKSATASRSVRAVASVVVLVLLQSGSSKTDVDAFATINRGLALNKKNSKNSKNKMVPRRMPEFVNVGSSKCRLKAMSTADLNTTDRPMLNTTDVTVQRTTNSDSMEATVAGHQSHEVPSHHIASIESSFETASATKPLALATNMSTESVHGRISPLDALMIGTTGVSFVLSLVGLLTAAGPGGWRYFLAGGICSGTAHALATPIDVVKTRKQVDPALMDKSFAQATAKIVKEEGINSLLAGLGPTTFGYLLEGAFKFGLYEITKPAVKRFLGWLAHTTSLAFLDSRLMGYILCGSISGVTASVLLCPMEAIRIRLVAEPDFAPRGWIQGGYLMLKNEGVASMSKGMTPMLYKQVPYTVAKNGGYDFATKLFYGLLRNSANIYRNSGNGVAAGISYGVPVLAALFASFISTVASQPGDVLLSLVNAHEGKKRVNDFVRDIAQSSNNGMSGFFVGIKTRFLHMGIIVTAQLLIYEFTKRLCGIAATGSV